MREALLVGRRANKKTNQTITMRERMPNLYTDQPIRCFLVLIFAFISIIFSSYTLQFYFDNQPKMEQNP